MKLKMLAVMVIFAFTACQSPRQEAIGKIEQLENDLFGEEGVLVHEHIDKLINAYLNFAEEYPDDTLAPQYLFKAGDIAMNTNRSNQAITYYGRIIEEYPDYRKAPEAMFLQAYVYENNLGRLDKARTIYQEFLGKYPTNEFADDAQVSLKYLGKTPEELIEIFSKENPEAGE
ncbi:MAG: tetratricopeptide repeat protein [Bacteroidota bacterium]